MDPRKPLPAVGERVAGLRQARHWSVRRLAAETGGAVAESTVRKIERGDAASPRLVTLTALAEALETDLEELVEWQPVTGQWHASRVGATLKLSLIPGHEEPGVVSGARYRVVIDGLVEGHLETDEDARRTTVLMTIRQAQIRLHRRSGMGY